MVDVDVSSSILHACFDVNVQEISKNSPIPPKNTPIPKSNCPVLAAQLLKLLKMLSPSCPVQVAKFKISARVILLHAQATVPMATTSN